jgi:hypothetical protein
MNHLVSRLRGLLRSRSKSTLSSATTEMTTVHFEMATSEDIKRAQALWNPYVDKIIKELGDSRALIRRQSSEIAALRSLHRSRLDATKSL